MPGQSISGTHGQLDVNANSPTVKSMLVQRVQGVLRRPCIVGRYGGEEFLVLLPDTNREEALLAAERIRTNATCQAGVPVCTVSIGLACLGGVQNDSLTALIGRADAGLYRAKEMGRNRVEEALA